MARAISRNCSTRSSCARKTSQYRPGSSVDQTSKFLTNELGRRSSVIQRAKRGQPTLRRTLRTEMDAIPAAASRWLKSTDWLAEHLRDRNVAVVDGSLFLPTQKRDAHAEYRAGHIPGAVFFDVDAISDHSTELPHMLPGAAQFGEVVGALGIGKGDTVVVY